MTQVIRDYAVEYLLPYAEVSTASADAGSQGLFRHKGKLKARSEQEAAEQILVKGGTIVSIKPERKQSLLLNPVPKDYKRQLLQATTFSVKGGMSAGRALQSVIESETGPLRVRLEPALIVLTSGGSCYEAIRALGFYDETTMAIIESGELTGNILDALETAAKHQDGRAAEQKIMFGAVSWTVMDILFSVSGIMGNIWGLLPQAEDSMAQVPPEAAERIEHAIQTAYMVNWALLFGSFIFIAIFLFCLFGALSPNARWRQAADKVMANVPFFNDAMRESAIAASCTVAASLVRGGVSLINVSDIASRSTRNWQVKSFWASVCERLNQGETIARCFTIGNLFSHSERILLVSHNSREDLSETLQVITAQRRTRAESAAKKFSAFAFFGSLFYSSIAVVVTLWVSYLQYTAMMTNNNSLG